MRFRLLGWLDRTLGKFMWVFIILGVVLSCMHQSSLGTLLVIAPTKLDPLWYTPFMPLLFLLSAISVGYPMVIVETTIATTSLKLDGEMEVLTPLSRFTILTLGLYLAVKIADLVMRGQLGRAFAGSPASLSFLVELFIGGVVPWFMLLSSKVRRSRRALFVVASCIVGGVLLNRINVFVVGFSPRTAAHPYSPAIGEILVTLGAAATIMFLYRVFVSLTPVLSARNMEEVSR